MYIISGCLCGINCKYNGGNNLNKKCLELYKCGQGILVCPEQLGGLSTPRNPSEIQNLLSSDEIDKIKIIDNTGFDVTDNFIKGAKEVLRLASEANVKVAILKEGSPSCGVNYIYDGTFSGQKTKGQGITTYFLKAQGIKVISDIELGGNMNGILELIQEENRRL